MNTALAPAAALRPKTMIAKPVWLDPAFEEPEAVLQMTYSPDFSV